MMHSSGAVSNVLDVQLTHNSQDIAGKGNIDSVSNQNTPSTEFVPFQYYATTGEVDEESSQLVSEKAHSTWDQKMDEA